MYTDGVVSGGELRNDANDKYFIRDGVKINARAYQNQCWSQSRRFEIKQKKNKYY